MKRSGIGTTVMLLTIATSGPIYAQQSQPAQRPLKQIASQLRIQPPTELDQRHKELAGKLSKFQAAEFDRDYINAMAQGHQEVLGKLRARTDSALPGAHGGGTDSGTGERRPPDKGLPNVTTNSNKPVAQDPALARAQAGKGATTGRGHGDDALTQWAAKAMPTVQKHLDRARELQQKLAK